MSSDAADQVRTLHPRPAAPAREPLWRDVVGDVLRRERRAQERTLQHVADQARISMPYLSEIERGRKEASSEVLAAAARALGLTLAELLALVHREIVRLAPPLPDERRGTVTSLASRTSVTALRAARPGGSGRATGHGEVRLAA
ncbi:helix-turn-helix domain-containing protein [Streptomyces avicenniae]|uniref:helix-turn-helix domain-containing protein n=1 Tax=Streptomyces avicenniae TaxID=500153 RepID=UPI00069A931A|nr:helix-turn-helix transcriptional regulator [Streptomyces avicenniae]